MKYSDQQGNISHKVYKGENSMLMVTNNCLINKKEIMSCIRNLANFSVLRSSWTLEKNTLSPPCQSCIIPYCILDLIFIPTDRCCSWRSSHKTITGHNVYISCSWEMAPIEQIMRAEHNECFKIITVGVSADLIKVSFISFSQH